MSTIAESGNEVAHAHKWVRYSRYVTKRYIPIARYVAPLMVQSKSEARGNESRTKTNGKMSPRYWPHPFLLAALRSPQTTGTNYRGHVLTGLKSALTRM